MRWTVSLKKIHRIVFIECTFILTNSYIYILVVLQLHSVCTLLVLFLSPSSISYSSSFYARTLALVLCDGLVHSWPNDVGFLFLDLLLRRFDGVFLVYATLYAADIKGTFKLIKERLRRKRGRRRCRYHFFNDATQRRRRFDLKLWHNSRRYIVVFQSTRFQRVRQHVHR